MGRGIRDAQILVLNNAQQLVGVGELGEIYIRTPYLSKGYIGDEAATRERFIINPFTGKDSDRLYRTGDLGRYLPDGNVEFLGRVDRQVAEGGRVVHPHRHRVGVEQLGQAGFERRVSRHR